MSVSIAVCGNSQWVRLAYRLRVCACVCVKMAQFWLAMEAVQLIASMTAAVACIWGSAVGCHGVCSCCYSNDDMNAVRKQREVSVFSLLQHFDDIERAMSTFVSTVYIHN